MKILRTNTLVQYKLDQEDQQQSEDVVKPEFLKRILQRAGSLLDELFVQISDPSISQQIRWYCRPAIEINCDSEATIRTEYSCCE